MNKIISEFVYFLILIVTGAIGWFLYINHKNFVNTNFFFAAVTFLVGSFALFIYLKQKSDERTNAATTVLLEIRSAESKIDIIIDKLDKKNSTDLPQVLPVNSWRKYSHLFVKNFDLDEIQLLNSFYSSCEIIEDLSNRQNNFVWVTTEERARAVQNILATIHDDFQKDSVAGDPLAKHRFDSRKIGLGEFFMNEGLSYAPEKILSGLRYQTQNIKRITTTPCGAKLKQLANLS